MSVITHQGYRGRMPRLNPRLLPANAAQVAVNCKLYNGDLRPFGGFAAEATLFHGASAVTIYRYWNAGTAYWFNWTTDVDVVPGPFAGDANNRRYYTGAADDVGSGARPKKTGSDIGTGAAGTLLPADWYWMGVQKPPKAPGVSESVAGSGDEQERFYVYTHVTADGEESGPSAPATGLTTKDGSTVIVDFFADVVASGATPAAETIQFVAAHNLPDYAKVQISANAPTGLSTGTDYYVIPVDSTNIKLATTLANALAGTAVNITASNTPTIELHGLDPRYNVTARRVYRTSPGLSGEAPFLFVAEVSSLATQTYSDSVDNVDLGEELPTLIDPGDGSLAEFAEPPTDLTGLTTVPGGFMAGYSPSLKQVCFSHPFHPYAWPTRYRFALDFVPVSIMAVGAGVLVGTVGRPYLFQGQHPAQMSRQMLLAQQGCVAKRGSVEFPGVGVYPSPDGLFGGGPGVERILTEALFSKREWNALSPGTFIAAVYDSRYFFIFDADGSGNNQVGILNPANLDEAFVTIDVDAKALFADLEEDALFMAVDGAVVKFDADATSPLVWRWRGKRESLPRPVNMAVMQIKADFGLSGIIAASSYATYEALRQTIIARNAALVYAGYDGGSMGMTALGMRAMGIDDYSDVPAALSPTVIYRLYDRNALIASIEIADDNPRRLPGGYLSDEFQVEMEGQIAVEEDRTATSVAELNEVP